MSYGSESRYQNHKRRYKKIKSNPILLDEFNKKRRVSFGKYGLSKNRKEKMRKYHQEMRDVARSLGNCTVCFKLNHISVANSHICSSVNHFLIPYQILTFHNTCMKICNAFNKSSES